MDGSSRTNASVSSGVTLFNGLQLQNQIRQAELDYKSLKLSTEETKENVSLGILSAYLQVLYAEELVITSGNQADATRGGIWPWQRRGSVSGPLPTATFCR